MTTPKTPSAARDAGQTIDRIKLDFKRVDDIHARRFDTIAGERDGSLDAALDAEELMTLANHLVSLRCSSHWSNPVFGGAFRRWMRRIESALSRRGVSELEVHNAFLSPRIIAISQP